MDEEFAGSLKKISTPCHTLRNYVMINKSWWDFLDRMFSDRNPLSMQPTVLGSSSAEKIPDFSTLIFELISEHYRLSLIHI